MAAGMGATCRGKTKSSDSGRLLGDAPVLVGVPPLLEAGLICRRLEDGRGATNVPQLVVHHSPTGFDWGYGGSGPADLALNVLAQLLPCNGPPSFDEEHNGRAFGNGWVSEDACALYQQFKRAFIEPLPAAGGHVHLEDMQAWVIRRVIAEAA